MYGIARLRGSFSGGASLSDISASAAGCSSVGGLLMKSPRDRHCSVSCFQPSKDARIPQGIAGTLKGRRGEALVGRPQPADGGASPWLPLAHPLRCSPPGAGGVGHRPSGSAPFPAQEIQAWHPYVPWKAPSHPQGRRAAARWAGLGLSWDAPAGQVQPGMWLSGVAMGRLAWSWVPEGSCPAACQDPSSETGALWDSVPKCPGHEGFLRPTHTAPSSEPWAAGPIHDAVPLVLVALGPSRLG